MTAPKRPQPASLRIAPDLPAPVLTPAERRLLEAFRAMDDDARDDAVKMLVNLAKDFTARAPSFAGARRNGITTQVRPTPAEEIAALHKSMSPWAQAKLLGMARDMVKTWPAKRGGHLRLVSLVDPSQPAELLQK